MSALGNYIHYSWQNYEEYGTKMPMRWKTRVAEEKNYRGASPFTVFIENIRARSQRVIHQDIQELEYQYNKQRLKQYEAFKRAYVTNHASYIELMKKVIKNADLGSDINVDLLAQQLVLDDTIQNVTIKDKNLLQENVEIKRIRQLAKGDDKTTSFLNTISVAYERAEKLVQRAPDPSLFTAELARIKQEIDTIEQLSREGEVYRRIQNTQSSKTYKAIIPRELARKLISEIIAVAKAADVSSLLSKLQGSFTEIMGVSLRPLYHRIAIDMIGDGLGNITSAPVINNKAGEQPFDTDVTVDLYLDQQTMREASNSSRGPFTIFQDENGVVTFKTDYSTKNKADFVLEWKGQELAVSAKAYDLSVADIYDRTQKQQVPNFISLHSGTSLLIYLLSLQQYSGVDDIGNHFLNIFVDHYNEETHEKEKEGGDYAAIRSQAQNALTIGMLYSGLTGDLLGKDPSTYANILMIEDKNASLAPNLFKVRFYNIDTIISSVIGDFTTMRDAIHFTPKLSTLRLKNKYDKQSARARITKTLLHARSKKIKVGLRIRSLPQFRG